MYTGTINPNVDAKVFDIGRAKTKGFEYNTTVGTPITGGLVISLQVLTMSQNIIYLI